MEDAEKRKAIVWFRNDLRLHDHRPLHAALSNGAAPVPVYVVDPRQFGKTAFGFPKIGYHRAQFLFEALADLRENLRKAGSDLCIRVGNPAEVLVEMAQHFQASSIYFSKEPMHEELVAEKELTALAESKGIEAEGIWQSTLFLPSDIPYSISKIPAVFTTFRKTVEHKCHVRSILGMHQSLPGFKGILPGRIPTPSDFGLERPEDAVAGEWPFRGGETFGLERLHYFIWESMAIAQYKQTRNGLLGRDFASKLSPWLALGCLSPRKVWEEVKLFEESILENESTYWLKFELLWRDYFRYWAAKHGNQVFQLQGIQAEWASPATVNPNMLKCWMEGTTGIPFVDANMRELRQTGFMSNRGRQNVASFWVHDLHQNWLAGAEYFESQLLDYDVTSNYGNWAYVAGVGADPRKDRYFNMMTQALKYDPEGAFVRHWIPEIANIPGESAQFVFDFDCQKQMEYGVILGVDYPNPVIRPKAWGLQPTPDK